MTSPFDSDLNPFTAPARDPFAPSAFDAAEQGPARFVMVRSGPDVNPKEFERAEQTAIEVMVLWGETVLDVRHLEPGRSFWIGEQDDKLVSCDYVVDAEKLGMPRAPFVVGSNGISRAVIIPGATGYVVVPGTGRMDVRQAIEKGVATPCAELAGAYEVPLLPETRVHLEVAGLVLQTAAVAAGRKPAAGLIADRDWSTSMFVGFSMLAHAAMIATVAMFMPSLGVTDAEAAEKDQLVLMQQYLSASAEREAEAREAANVTTEQNADDKEGGSGQRAAGEEGKMGSTTSTATNRTYGVKGPKDNTDPRIARQAAITEAQNFGMIGLINTGAGGDPNAPTAPWGRDDSLGTDPISARGNMWGESIGDAFGGGGLGLSGIGEGGGGRGEGIGLDMIGTIGRGAGTCQGVNCQGIGRGHGRLAKGHTTKAPVMREGTTVSTGKIPPEVIQRIVRQNFGRFRVCYENALRTNPNLQGRVTTRFIISREGTVANASNGGSDIPDPGVVSCVVSAFYGMSFPAPQGGIVTVTYPIMFAPGG